LTLLVTVFDRDRDERVDDLLAGADGPWFQIKVAHYAAHQYLRIVRPDDHGGDECEMRADLAARFVTLAAE
jgi:hypothetical protein